MFDLTPEDVNKLAGLVFNNPSKKLQETKIKGTNFKVGRRYKGFNITSITEDFDDGAINVFSKDLLVASLYYYDTGGEEAEVEETIYVKNHKYLNVMLLSLMLVFLTISLVIWWQIR